MEGPAHRRLRRRREGVVPARGPPGEGAEQLALRDGADRRLARRGRLRLPADTLRRLPRSSQSNAGRKSAKGLIMGRRRMTKLAAQLISQGVDKTKISLAFVKTQRTKM